LASASPARPPRFRVTRADEPPIAVLAVEGEIDLVTAPRLKDALHAIPKASPVVVDLCEALFIDSSGLRVLVMADERRHGRLHVACSTAGAVRRALDVALAGVLAVHSDRAAAVTAARPAAT
jgi:anti-sigma B factor antagonist